MFVGCQKCGLDGVPGIAHGALVVAEFVGGFGVGNAESEAFLARDDAAGFVDRDGGCGGCGDLVAVVVGGLAGA
ncbi:hypothetical protein [Embleya sp. NPDC020886]|uniref:hypothetical protein n=1 Tax=Embleya sp. NPDC020886 TaxID=3363980 RepID=UPI0037A8F78A